MKDKTVKFLVIPADKIEAGVPLIKKLKKEQIMVKPPITYSFLKDVMKVSASGNLVSKKK